MNRKQSIFAETPASKPQRNQFDLSHEVKTSGKFGYLYPMLVQEALPGDTFNDTTTIMLRVAPMLAPIMHRVSVITHFFFVPIRILIPDIWEEFITGGQDGLAQPVLPYITPAGVAASSPLNMYPGTLWDHLGLPVLSTIPAVYNTEQISALPFWAYDKIFNDWYRDPNFSQEIAIEPAEGNVTTTFMANGNMVLRKKGWRKDYFTSALAAPQRGAQVLMPLSGTGSVTYKPVSTVHTSGGGQLPIGTYVDAQTGGSFSEVEKLKVRTDPGGVYTEAQLQNIDDVVISNSSVTINDLRVALATQSWLEANARGGYRYVDQIDSHFDVRVPDYRLQRAEYLGGGRQPVRISEVLTTSSTYSDGVGSTEGTGNMAGHGLSVGKTNKFHYRCQEHGIIVGIFTVIPDSAYMQGLDRMWSRKSKFDYAWPLLAHLGEQSILSKELYFSFDNVDDTENQDTFGYTPRYAEYKFKNDVITGDMRQTLLFWNLGRQFTTRPVLDAAFTTVDENGDDGDETSMRRIFAVEDGTDYLWIQMFHRLTANRPLPYFGVPRLIG